MSKTDLNTTEWYIPSNPLRVPPLVREALGILSKKYTGLAREEFGDIKLILNELIYNAVLHGNLSDETKQVHVKLVTKQNHFCVSITDEGSGFDAETAFTDLTQDENLRMESGRGLTLAKALADELIFSDGGRKVTFLKRIGVLKPPMPNLGI